jgi:lipopolysaccharide transport system ATP-binding protein
MNGRIASLLEVGTGFHPELTGRENIFLNGAILGMRKHEIKTKFDEIVDFAGIEKYIDTPVKRYSSGMYVRLAFAVAAHLESEILIVDEVLAVGDADFQKRCLGKMGDISKGEGRTVLFVSHNMSAISALCNRCLVFNKGKLDFDGDTTTAISHYLSSNIDSIYQTKNINDIILPIIKKAWFENLTGKVTSNFYNGDPIVILIESANPLNMPLEISLAFFDNMKRPLWNFTHAMHGLSSIPKDNKLLNKFTFFPPPLTVNEVSIDIGIGPKGGTPYFDHVISGLKYTILNKEEGTMYVKHPEWPIFCEVKLESEKLI